MASIQPRPGTIGLAGSALGGRDTGAQSKNQLRLALVWATHGFNSHFAARLILQPG